jgi:hydrogenase maturation protease
MKRLLVLCLGNEIMSDDGVGIVIARELERIVAPAEFLHIEATCEMGLALLDYMIGYHTCLVIDAINTEADPPGTLYQFAEDDLSCLRGAAPHFLGLREVLSLGRLLGLEMPETVKVLAIAIRDSCRVSNEMSVEVQNAVSPAVSMIVGMIDELSGTFLFMKERD